jgi:hypothetical protein
LTRHGKGSPAWRSAWEHPTSGRAVVVTVEDEPEIRVEKIMDIRRQLGEGRYSILDRLDVVVDRLLRDLG